jgi:hypothetical protein
VPRSLNIIARTFPTKGKQSRTHPLRANKRGHTHCGQTIEDTPIAGNMTPRGPPHGRRQAGGAPPGLQQSRMNTRTREAQNYSSEVEPMTTEISAQSPVMAALRQRRYTRSFATRATTATQYQIIWKLGSAATCLCLERNCAVGPPRSDTMPKTGNPPDVGFSCAQSANS